MMNRDQWIFVRRCGCPVGVMEGYLADTGDEAFLEMYDNPPQVQAAKERGIDTRLISWSEYEKNYFERMRPTYRCPH
jgi:hypothetical protein